MDPRSLPATAAVVKIDEINELPSDELHNKSVRITGRLEAHQYAECRAQLVSPRTPLHSSLEVDTRLVEPFNARLGSLVQFIGEMEGQGDDTSRRLTARVVRCVDGLDLALYHQAVDVQREYIEGRPATVPNMIAASGDAT